MVERRGNKGSARPRKPTVAGRKRTGATDDVSTPDVEASAVVTPEVATPEVTPAPVNTSLVKPDDDFTAADASTLADADAVDASDVDVDESDSAATDSESSDAESSDADAADSTDSDAKDSDSTPSKPSGKARRPVSRVSTIRASSASTEVADSKPVSRPAGLEPKPLGRKAGDSRKPASNIVNWRTTTIIACAAAALAIIAAVLAWHPGASASDNKAFVDKAATTEVLSQGRAKVCAPFAYEVNGFDKWVSTARGALTGQALDEFNKNIDAQKQIVQQSNSSVDCRLDTVGVQTLSGDRAVLVANLVLSRNISGSVLDSQTARVQADMVKKGDTWLMERIYTL